VKIETDEQGGRVFFSSTGRTLSEEDEICILSVGVDIGSSTSHLVFSRIVLERLDSRYVVTQRETFYQSDILLTPYSSEDAIDADALGAFFAKQYENAMVDPDEIDAGALILTGVAVRRSNARRIGELFAGQAGKLVAVSAGDNLETVMAAYGSGAVARSIRDRAAVMNVDVGGGTSKIAVCRDGAVIAITAVDVGARLVCTDEAGRITRLEEYVASLADYRKNEYSELPPELRGEIAFSGRTHRPGGNDKRFGFEGPKQESEDKRDNDGFDGFPQRPGTGGLAMRHRGFLNWLRGYGF
jgi:ethanolamine utilization protein EutA